MLSIAISDVRDLVIVLWGAVSILLTLIALAIVSVILWFGRKGMAKVHELLNDKGVKGLEQAHKIAVQVRDRTAKLPGAPGSDAGAGELINTAQDVRNMKPPFRRRIRSWRPI